MIRTAQFTPVDYDAVERAYAEGRAMAAAAGDIAGAAELGVDVLINNAGIIRDNMLFKMSVDDWDSVMAVHLKGAFLMTKACQKYMTEAKYGRIVNLSSTSALGNRGQANYSAAKAGMQGFTKTLAIELGKFGITANSIAVASPFCCDKFSAKACALSAFFIRNCVSR